MFCRLTTWAHCRFPVERGDVFVGIIGPGPIVRISIIHLRACMLIWSIIESITVLDLMRAVRTPWNLVARVGLRSRIVRHAGVLWLLQHILGTCGGDGGSPYCSDLAISVYSRVCSVGVKVGFLEVAWWKLSNLTEPGRKRKPRN
jgi:hypothetical protein